MYLYHMTFSANRNLFHYHETSSHVLEASIKTPKEILFCKQTGLYEARISCKGTLRAASYVYCFLENQIYVFQTAPVVVYRLMTSVAPVLLTESVFM